MPPNKYGGQCSQHHIDIDSYCPECLQFRCIACTDPHTDSILKNEELSKCISLLQSKQACMPNKSQLDDAKAALIKKFNDSINTLKAEFNLLLDHISSFCEATLIQDKSILDFGLNKKAILHLLSSNLFIEGDVRFNTEPRFKQLIDNAKYTIDAIDKLALEFTKQMNYPLQTVGNVHFIQKKSIVIANISSNTKYIIDLDRPISPKAESISVGDSIYFTGGLLTNESINSVVEVQVSQKKAIERSSMLIKKYYHMLCENNYYIYAVGGLNGLYITDSQRYSILKDKWENLPNLLVPRGSGAIFTFNKVYVYIIAGFNETGNLSSVERLFIPSPKEWESISLAETFPPRNSIQAMQISEGEVIAFGSYSKSKESFILKISDKSFQFEKGPALLVGGRFHATAAPIFNSICLYGVDNKDNIHVFSTLERKWGIIKSGR